MRVAEPIYNVSSVQLFLNLANFLNASEKLMRVQRKNHKCEEWKGIFWDINEVSRILNNWRAFNTKIIYFITYQTLYIHGSPSNTNHYVSLEEVLYCKSHLRGKILLKVRPLMPSPTASFFFQIGKIRTCEVDSSMYKELVARSYSETGGQWLKLWIKISDKWCLSGISADTDALHHWHWQQDWINPQKVCGWQQAVWCNQHVGGMRWHPERL